MKTLDETIHEIESKIAAKTTIAVELIDALRYLKEYKTFIELLSKNEEIIIGTTSTYKIELTKPEFNNIIIK